MLPCASLFLLLLFARIGSVQEWLRFGWGNVLWNAGLNELIAKVRLSMKSLHDITCLYFLCCRFCFFLTIERKGLRINH